MKMKPIKLKGLSEEKTAELLPENLIFAGYRGSIAHGTYDPGNEIDDKDVICVFMGHLESYLGCWDIRAVATQTQEGPWDVVSYEFRHIIRLLLRSNPNVLSTLWLDRKHVLYSSPAWEHVRTHRDAFVSTKRARDAFSGYAHSQLHRMKHHAPTGRLGDKRKKLVEKFGYDTKNAAHLIRLLRMAAEYLKTGALTVERPDATELLDIKRGCYTLEEIERKADKLFELAEKAYIESTLPLEPNEEVVNLVCIEVLWSYLQTQMPEAKKGWLFHEDQ